MTAMPFAEATEFAVMPAPTKFCPLPRARSQTAASADMSDPPRATRWPVVG